MRSCTKDVVNQCLEFGHWFKAVAMPQLPWQRTCSVHANSADAGSIPIGEREGKCVCVCVWVGGGGVSGRAGVSHLCDSYASDSGQVFCLGIHIWSPAHPSAPLLVKVSSLVVGPLPKQAADFSLGQLPQTQHSSVQ